DLSQGLSRGLCENGETLLRDRRAVPPGRVRRPDPSVPQAVRELRVMRHRARLRPLGPGSHAGPDLPESQRHPAELKRPHPFIMEGRSLRDGAVAAIEQIRHPISAARLVMEETEHVLLVGEPATRFARYFKLKSDRQPVPRRISFKPVHAQQASGPTKKTLDLYRAMRVRRTVGLETVGAVAVDRSGTVGCGASTGGVGRLLTGREGATA